MNKNLIENQTVILYTHTKYSYKIKNKNSMPLFLKLYPLKISTYLTKILCLNPQTYRRIY